MTKRMTAGGHVVQPRFAPYLTKLFWVVVLVWLGFLMGIARDPIVPLSETDQSAAPTPIVSEDWHGNVRRSWGR